MKTKPYLEWHLWGHPNWDIYLREHVKDPSVHRFSIIVRDANGVLMAPADQPAKVAQRVANLNRMLAWRRERARTSRMQLPTTYLIDVLGGFA